ncbi:glucagon a [Garra rufa]|uniref:glucagon a n=1 Tax=Garra rufa TaxID=137080 RepID=UPI003CCEDCC8
MDLNAHVRACVGCPDGTAHLDRLYKTQTIEKRPRNQQETSEEKIQAHSTLPLTDPKEAVKMKAVQYLAGLLLLLFVQLSICVPLQDDSTSTETVESLLARGQGFTTAKRHSEGTFSNDYSKYLETRRAQDFVQWLMNSKRNGYVQLQCGTGVKMIQHLV